MKPFDLFISDEHKQAIRDGAKFVAVEWTESDTSASGRVTHAGTEDECKGHLCVKMVVVPHGITAHAAVWDASEISQLIEA